MRWCFLALSVGVTVACSSPGGEPDGGAADGGQTDSGSWFDCDLSQSPGPGAYPAPDCSGYVGLASRAELDATPRVDTNLEQLAISMSGGFVADQATYDRIVSDVAQIRSARPELENVGYFPSDDGRSFMLFAENDALAAMAAGEYDAWACLDDWYTITSVQVDEFGCLAFVEFKGIYDTMQLFPQVESLAGVDSAIPNFFIGDGPSICGTVDGIKWHYVFDLAGGDCPSGCIEHSYFYFTSEPAAAPIEVGFWDAASATTAPAWVVEYGSCRF